MIRLLRKSEDMIKSGLLQVSPSSTFAVRSVTSSCLIPLFRRNQRARIFHLCSVFHFRISSREHLTTCGVPAINCRSGPPPSRRRHGASLSFHLGPARGRPIFDRAERLPSFICIDNNARVNYKQRAHRRNSGRHFDACLNCLEKLLGGVLC